MTHIGAITKNNYLAFLNMDVHDFQKPYIADNATSIAQKHFHPDADIHGIFDKDEPIGFAMLRKLTPEDNYGLIDLIGSLYLWRFMIAKAFQGLGHGARALACLQEYYQNDSTDMIFSFMPGAHSPQPFYEKHGFVMTEKVERSGMIVMRKEFGI